MANNTSVVPLEVVSAAGLLPYIDDLGTDLIGCELGVCKAFTLRYFLDLSDKIKKVYAIDAWAPYMDWWGMVGTELTQSWKAQAIELLRPHRHRVEILEMSATQASKKIKDLSLDYIFIDGDHSYDNAYEDVTNYWPKVRQGGIFAGHDWNLFSVKTAVKHFRELNNITTPVQFTESNVWFWYKE